MKNTYIILLFLIFIIGNLNPLFAQQQDYYYHYPLQGKIQLDASDEKIMVKFKKGTSMATQINQLSSNSFRPLFTIENQSTSGIAVIRLVAPDPSLLENLCKSLLQDNADITYVHPMLSRAGGKDIGVQEELLVKLHQADDLAQLEAKVLELGAIIHRQSQFDALLYHVRLTENALGNTLYIANRLYETGLFRYAEPNFIHFDVLQNTNDPFVGQQWALMNDGINTAGQNGIADADMDVFEAWQITTGSSDIKIAVLDDGVDLNHPDLVNNLLPGFGTIGNSEPGSAEQQPHGTACSGIIAAQGNNNLGVAGVAYNCKIMPVRIVLGGVFSTTEVVDGINWAWQNGADILSNSYGGGLPSAAVEDAINQAVSQGRGGLGCLFLAASGNESLQMTSGNQTYPATYANAIAVGASTQRDRKASFSNFGFGLDVVAPGSGNIYTTDLTGAAGYQGGDYMPFFAGTSAACPNAAGVMALILSLNPHLTAQEARKILESSCDKVGAYTYTEAVDGQPNGTWSEEFGYGRVNAHKALQSMLLAEYDVRLTTKDREETEFLSICGYSFTPALSLQNLGSETLTQLEIHYQLDNNSEEVWNWTGSLAQFEKEELTFPAIPISLGRHVFKIFTQSPNGQLDEFPANNSLELRPTAYEWTGTNIIYVNENARGNKDGTSWQHAFTDLQEAIDVNKACLLEATTEIWVASGTYYPTRDRAGQIPEYTRDRTFYFDFDTKIYGGFTGTPGTENDFTARNLNSLSVLSGDLGILNDKEDNTFHIIHTKNVSTDFILDGFQLEEGNASTFGGALFNDNSSPMISNCIFTHNTANVGGAMYNSGYIRASSPRLINCSFFDNSASFGGAIANDGKNGISNPDLLNCSFSNNEASFGGAIYNLGQFGISNPILTDCTFSNNTSTFGGALLNHGEEGVSSPQLENCTFSGNSAGSGGAIHNFCPLGISSPKINNCSFLGNSGSLNDGFGGAILNEGIEGVSSPLITNCTFFSNSASGGGAILNQGHIGTSNTRLENCTFFGNFASIGGAVLNNAEDGTSSVEIKNCTFNNNSAALYGGALYSTGDNGTTHTTITNALFFNNQAGEIGGVLGYDDSDNGSPQFVNCTFSGNTAPQGGVVGIRFWDSKKIPPVLKNCIAWNNSATFVGQGSLDIQYSLIQENNCPANATCDDNTLFNLDPLFKDVGTDNYRLAAGSPAIDQGDNILIKDVQTDLDNLERILDGTGDDELIIDLGAYEFIPAALAVEWLHFQAKLNQQQETELHWRTASEQDNAYFTIEHSTDGRFFAAIGTVTGKGNSAPTQSYFYLDTKPKQGLNYYRILQTDNQGKTSSSLIQTITVGKASVRIYPNPVQDQLRLEFYAPQSTDLDIVLHNVLGQQQIQFGTTAQKGLNQQVIDVTTLTRGIYWLTLKTDKSTVWSGKVMVE